MYADESNIEAIVMHEMTLRCVQKPAQNIEYVLISSDLMES